MIGTAAAASSAVRKVIMEPSRRGVLLGVFAQVLIVGVETNAGQRVISLLTPQATRVPNGVFIPTVSTFDPPRPTDQVDVGDGRVVVGHLRIHVSRWWDSRARSGPPDPTALSALAAAAAGATCGVPAEPIDDLRRALTGPRDALAPAAAVQGLIGLGLGLTPAGDDILAGTLIGLHANRRTEIATEIGAHVLARIGRTTLLSADLLRLAAQGSACLEVLAVLRARGAQVAPAINRLLSIGHTSGADLATGLAIGLEVS